MLKQHLKSRPGISRTPQDLQVKSKRALIEDVCQVKLARQAGRKAAFFIFSFFHFVIFSFFIFRLPIYFLFAMIGVQPPSLDSGWCHNDMHPIMAPVGSS